MLYRCDHTFIILIALDTLARVVQVLELSNTKSLKTGGSRGISLKIFFPNRPIQQKLADVHWKYLIQGNFPCHDGYINPGASYSLLTTTKMFLWLKIFAVNVTAEFKTTVFHIFCTHLYCICNTHIHTWTNNVFYFCCIAYISSTQISMTFSQRSPHEAVEAIWLSFNYVIFLWLFRIQNTSYEMYSCELFTDWILAQQKFCHARHTHRFSFHNNSLLTFICMHCM